MRSIEWELLRVGAHCNPTKTRWRIHQTLEACFQFCENDQSTILVYRKDTKMCACCNNPPEQVLTSDGINMYQNIKSKLIRQL